MKRCKREEKERLIKTSVYLEEEVIESLKKMAEQLTTETGKRWSTGGVVRLALSEFFTRRGKII